MTGNLKVAPAKMPPVPPVYQYSSSSDDDDDEFDDLIAQIDLPPPIIRTMVSPDRGAGQTNTRNLGWTIFIYSTVDDNFNGDGLPGYIQQAKYWGTETVPATVAVVNDVPTISTLSNHIETFDDIGVHESVVTDQLNPVTKTCFGKALQSIGIPALNHGGDMLKTEKGKLVPASNGLTFIATVVPLVNKCPSKENVLGQPPGDVRYWQGQVVHRQKKEGGTLSFMEVAMKIPMYLLNNDQQGGHTNAVTGVRGPFIDQVGHFKFVAYNQYAHILAKLLSLPICQVAAEGGWKPLLVFKDTVCQAETRYGINGFKMGTCDQGCRTFICLVGFTRTRSRDGSQYDVIGLLKDGTPITLRSEATILL